jgi:hypothetical protein
MIAASGSSSGQQTTVRPRSEDAAGVVILRCVLFAALLAGMSRTWADPDLWGHLRFGRDILAGGIPHADPYSFTSDIPWVNHEWLAEVAMDLVWTAIGAPGLILLKMGLTGAALLFVARVLKFEHAEGPQRDLVLFAAIAGMWARVFVIRPQVFSVALFAAVLWMLRSAERGRTSRLWLLPFVFMLWVNLHGGWIVGLGVLIMWTSVQASPFRRSGVPWPAPAGVTILSAFATLINPYGLGMWTFLAGSVGLNRPNINDWRPLIDSGATVIVPWLISATLAVVAFARGRRSIPVAHALIVLALGVGSIRVNRLDVSFTLSVVMLLGGHLTASRSQAGSERRPHWTRRVVAAAAAAAMIGAAAAWSFRASFSCLRLDGPWMPEREAGQFIVQNQLTGRMLIWFDWGQYAIWHFDPRIHVSLDGRRETVYSDAFVAAHLQLYFEPESQQELLRRLAPDYAWLPVEVPLAAALERQGWHRAYSGPVSVVLARHLGIATPVAPPTSPPCFPGP